MDERILVAGNLSLEFRRYRWPPPASPTAKRLGLLPLRGGAADAAGTGSRHRPARFEDELIRLIPHLRRLAYQMTWCAASADDLLQDTLERALVSRVQFQAGTNLRAWLSKIMRNQFRSDLRRPARRAKHVDITDLEHLMGRPGQQNAIWAAREFARAFATLPRQEQITLSLVGLEGLDYSEASEALGVRIGTIKSRTSRARHRLAACLAGSRPMDVLLKARH